MKILPAIDLLNGKCVQLEQGNQDKVLFSCDAIEQAKFFESEGAKILWLVDLNAALGIGKDNFSLIKQIIKNSKIPVFAGGGVRTLEKANNLINAGADKIVIGTKTLDKNFVKKLSETFGSDKLIAALDCKNRKISIKGWKKQTAFAIDAISEKINDFVSMYLITNINVEGKQIGPDFEFIEKVLPILKKPVLISGGISSIEDIKKISDLGAYGIIVGIALYTKKFTLKEAVQCLQKE